MTIPAPATPARLQLSRRKGFDLQALSLATNGLAAVKVARPGMWGNPYAVRPDLPVGYFVCRGKVESAVKTAKDAVARFENWIVSSNESAKALRSRLPEIRGRNLACFCRLDQPCHADTLLHLANFTCEDVS